ncbi:MAG: hypothetical protein ABSG71_16515 [Thermodesulfobacteriota bacterium]|jgi:hypothetical protein
MIVYYEKVMELWRAGKLLDAVEYFNQCKKEGLLSEEEIEELDKKLPEFGELIEEECEENPEVIFNLYTMLKRAKSWDDETLCMELKISEKTLGDIKSHYRPRSKKVGPKMFYELFPELFQ